MFRRTIAGILLCILLLVIVFDSAFHFDADLIKLKAKHYSAQRNWNIFYGQRYVYNDAPFRYEADFIEIEKRIKPKSLLLTDLATSYYSAARLPVYVANIHRHHGRWRLKAWKQFINDRDVCYMEFEENQIKVSDFLKKHTELDYFIVNRDKLNTNMRGDCLAFRQHTLTEQLPKVSRLVFKGEYLDLYKIWHGSVAL